MNLPIIGTLSVDLVIIATVVALVLFMIVLGHGKLRNLALASYVGWVLAAEFAATVHGVAGSLSLGTIRLVLYVAPILLLEFGRRHQDAGPRQGLIFGLVMAVATAALIISGVLTQFDPGTRETITGSSQIAFLIYNLRLVWLGVVPVLAMLEGFIKPKDKHH